jgi:hypothetical protein
MVAVNFFVMVVAPWVSDLLLAWGGGRRHGVWSMGVAVWVAGMGGWRSVGKKNGCGRVGCWYARLLKSGFYLELLGGFRESNRRIES